MDTEQALKIVDNCRPGTAGNQLLKAYRQQQAELSATRAVVEAADHISLDHCCRDLNFGIGCEEKPPCPECEFENKLRAIDAVKKAGGEGECETK